MTGKLVQRQVIVEWYIPEERLPKEDDGVIATISGSANGILFDHAMVLLYWDNKEGWQSSDYEFSELMVHAWCDLEPYGG